MNNIHANLIIQNWELSLSATILHYLNKTYTDLGLYVLYPSLAGPYAHSWSTLKGLSLALQFNPKSDLSYEQLVDFHNKLKTTPKIYNDAIGQPLSERDRIIDYSGELYDALPIISDELFPGSSSRSW